MSKSLPKITTWFLALTIAGLLFLKAYQLTRISFALDDLNTQLADVKKIIHPGATIGYYSANNSSSSFVETSFAMAPAILMNNINRDTILVIGSKTTVQNYFGRYRLLTRKESGNTVTSLITSAN